MNGVRPTGGGFGSRVNRRTVEGLDESVTRQPGRPE